MDTTLISDNNNALDEEAAARKKAIKKRNAFTFAAILLFVLALYGLWQTFINVVRVYEAPDLGFYVSLGLTFFSLLLMAVVLVEDSKLAERMRIGNSYQQRIDQMRESVTHNQELLRMVTNHQTSAISVFDENNRYVFVNDIAEEELGRPASELIGQHPNKVISSDEAKKLDVHLAWARTLDEPRVSVERMTTDEGETRFVRRYYSRLSYKDDSVILREEDVTSMIVERERREQMLRQVIDTLVAVVDRRDPYATGHSKRVGQLAKAIAEEMGLDKIDVEAAEIAGSLMNFGKVLVSRRILTKTSALSPEELQRVRDSILVSADILGIIGFEGPVVPTLRQVLERFDGTGAPDGLKGEDILLTARIVAACNAFVAFVSPRAHREGLAFKEALNVMANDSGKAFDERVLVAMAHYIENRPNKMDWLLVKPG